VIEHWNTVYALFIFYPSFFGGVNPTKTVVKCPGHPKIKRIHVNKILFLEHLHFFSFDFGMEYILDISL